ncbi:unnamed protein product, partial [Prorocentrum cordatum]
VLGPRAPVHVRDPLAPAGRLRPAPDRHQRGARHRPGAPGRPAGGRRAADRLQRRRPRVPQPHVDDVRALGRVRGRRRAPRRTGLHLLVRRVREVRAAQVLRAAAARCRVTRRLRARARHLEARARLSRVRVSEGRSPGGPCAGPVARGRRCRGAASAAGPAPTRSIIEPWRCGRRLCERAALPAPHPVGAALARARPRAGHGACRDAAPPISCRSRLAAQCGHRAGASSRAV